MSTRGSLIKLSKEKCEIDYIHHGLDFVIKLFYLSNGDITSEAMREMLKEEMEEYPWHIDVTDERMIDRLFRYDTEIIEMDSELFLFYENRGHHIDLTLKWTSYNEVLIYRNKPMT